MSTVTCPNCNTKNTEGSKFCNRCGTALPRSTHVVCPNCQTRNPRNLLYCDNCGARLAVTGELAPRQEEEKEPEPESKGPTAFSLPAREPGDELEDELDPDRLLDWLRTGEEQAAETAAAETAAAETAAETAPDTTEQESVLGDWLSELSDVEDTAEPESEEELPDWFAEEGGAPESDSDEEGLMDWLSELEQDESDQDAEEETLAGWLDEFEADDEGEAEPEAEELTDWLDEFEVEDEEAAEAEAPVDDGLPDWLGEEETAEETPTIIESQPEAEEAEELPDWLSDYDEEGAEPDPSFFERIPSEGAELPDWLSDLEEPGEPDSGEEETPAMMESTPEAEEGEELPDWLSDFDEEETVTAETVEEEILPDWLGDFEEDDEEPAAVEAAEEAAVEAEAAGWPAEFEDEDEETAVEETLPDWLSDFDEDEEAAVGEETAVEMETPSPAEAEAPDEAGEEEELPDWLADMPSYDTKILSSEEEETGEEAEDIFAGLEEEDLTPVDEQPDWMSEVAPQKAEESVPEEGSLEETAEAEAAVDDDMPDWLSEFPDDFEELDEDEDTDWLEALTQEDWPEVADEEDIFAQLEGPEEEPASEAPPTGPSQELKGVPKELAGEGLPDWLQEDMPPGSEQFEEEGETYFGDEDSELVAGEIPDWLQEMKPAVEGERAFEDDFSSAETGDEWQGLLEGMPPADPNRVGEGGALSAAEIPAWLQALKPGDIGEEELEEPEFDEEPETEGPLAGLRGVLPVAPIVAEPVAAPKPVEYTISKEQQQQIALLHQLTHEEEVKTKQVVHKEATTFSAAWRTLLGLLLLLVIVGGLLLPGMDIGLPETALPVPSNAFDAYNTIDGISGRSVLVAFDYTPAMAGELDPMALMLLRQMAANGNRVVTISQSAAGTAIAERLVGEVDGIESRALPLLPGEAVGLRSLGACLNAAENCESLNYDTGNAELMADLADVGLVIVLTGDRNSFVNWIEQVENQNEAPMIAAVTQPLGPLTIPYLSSEQLEGSINGIPAASAYEKRLLGQDGSAFTAYSAQTIVLWVVIAALVVGALFYGLAGVVRPGN